MESIDVAGVVQKTEDAGSRILIDVGGVVQKAGDTGSRNDIRLKC